MKVIVLYIIIPLFSGIAGALLVYWLGNRKELYNNKKDILSHLLKYRFMQDIPYYEEEFQKYLFMVEVVFHKNKKVINQYKELIKSIPYYFSKTDNRNKNILISINYCHLLQEIIKDLKLGKLCLYKSDFEDNKISTDARKQIFDSINEQIAKRDFRSKEYKENISHICNFYINSQNIKLCILFRLYFNVIKIKNDKIRNFLIQKILSIILKYYKKETENTRKIKKSYFEKTFNKLCEYMTENKEDIDEI